MTAWSRCSPRASTSSRSTDHDFRTELRAGHRGHLGASSLIATAPGEEITTFDYGHFNAWPMTIDPAQVNGGAVDYGGAAPAGQDFPSFGNYSLTPAADHRRGACRPGRQQHGADEPHPQLLRHRRQLRPRHRHRRRRRRSRRCPAPRAVSTRRDELLRTPDVASTRSRSGSVTTGRQVYTNFLGQNAGDWFNLLNQGIGRPASPTPTRTIACRHAARASRARSSRRPPTRRPASAPSPTRCRRTSTTGASSARNAPDGAGHGVSPPPPARTGRLELGLPTQIATNDGAVDVHGRRPEPGLGRVRPHRATTSTRTTTCSSSP